MGTLCRSHHRRVIGSGFNFFRFTHVLIWKTLPVLQNQRLLTMHYAAQFVVFLAVAFGIAIGMWPLYRTRRAGSWFALFVSAANLFSPIVTRSEHITLRALACVLAVDLFFKTIDYALQGRQDLVKDRGFLSYARFLLPFPVFL